MVKEYSSNFEPDGIQGHTLIMFRSGNENILITFPIRNVFLIAYDNTVISIKITY